MRLPGVCISCREEVIWNGHWWKAPGRGKGRRHVCPVRCGKLMPMHRDRCARRPHENTDCRSEYAMENERQAKRGGGI